LQLLVWGDNFFLQKNTHFVKPLSVKCRKLGVIFSPFMNTEDFEDVLDDAAEEIQSHKVLPCCILCNPKVKNRVTHAYVPCFFKNYRKFTWNFGIIYLGFGWTHWEYVFSVFL
jgi:hypothetical protein